MMSVIGICAGAYILGFGLRTYVLWKYAEGQDHPSSLADAMIQAWRIRRISSLSIACEGHVWLKWSYWLMAGGVLGVFFSSMAFHMIAE
jgi:hypothetical protein